MAYDKTYLVTWAIDIDADDPVEAARLAMNIMRDNDPENMATIFRVVGKSGVVHMIDAATGEIQ